MSLRLTLSLTSSTVRAARSTPARASAANSTSFYGTGVGSHPTPAELVQMDEEENRYLSEMATRHAMISLPEDRGRQTPPAPVTHRSTPPLLQEEVEWLAECADIHARCEQQG